MRLKLGVTGARIFGIQPELLLGLLIAYGIYKKFNLELVVTCVTDAKHNGASLHYVGFAADLGMPPADKVNLIVEELKNSLGTEFDVVKETDHIHIEFQPKVGLNLNA